MQILKAIVSLKYTQLAIWNDLQPQVNFTFFLKQKRKFLSYDIIEDYLAKNATAQ